jgi:hypothetical protein
VALQDDRHDRVPVLLGHVDERTVSQDPRVVDEDVEVTEGVDRLGDEGRSARPVRDVERARLGGAARRPDLLDDVGGEAPVGAGAVDRRAPVVDEDSSALGGEQQSMRPTETSARARDDRDLPVELPHLRAHAT